MKIKYRRHLGYFHKLYFFELEKDEVTEDRWSFHDEELHDFHFSQIFW
jgi:hypothetical protein